MPDPPDVHALFGSILAGTLGHVRDRHGDEAARRLFFELYDHTFTFLAREFGREALDDFWRHIADTRLGELERLGASIWTPRDDARRAGIVFFRTPEHDELYRRLKAQRIYCGNFLGGIRADPNFYNTYEELDRFLDAVRRHVASHAPGP